MSDTEQAIEDQHQLAEASLPAIFEAYDEAVEEGLDAPVVLLIDCEDPLGAEIARAWLGDETVDEAIALESAPTLDGSSEEEPDEDEPRTTVFVAAFEFESCQTEIPKVFPYLGEVFQNPLPDDGVLVVSITSGGATALTAPLDARP